jgi:hypothetical protein
MHALLAYLPVLGRLTPMTKSDEDMLSHYRMRGFPVNEKTRDLSVFPDQ